MGAFFVYIVKSGLALAVFYLFYRLLMAKETFHRFNRIALLGILGISLLLPFIRYSAKPPQIVTQLAAGEFSWTDLSMVMVTEMEVPVVPLFIKILLVIYLIGVTFFLFQTGFVFRHLFKRMRGTYRKIKKENLCIYITSHQITPFSWMNRIFVSEQDWQENGTKILIHEMGHIKYRHSWDILFTQLCAIFYWFNPAVWLLKQELQNIHEFEADAYVLKNGINAKDYQLLLIKKAVGSQRFTSMANSFNHSKLKKRMTMMLKRKSNPWARLKYLYVLPLSVIVTTTLARPEITRELEKISGVGFTELLPDRKDVSQEKVIRPDMVLLSEPVLASDTLIVRRLGEDKNPLILINGEEVTREYMDALEPLMIENVSVLKGAAAIDIHGEKGKNGVILIELRKGDLPVKQENDMQSGESRDGTIVLNGVRMATKNLQALHIPSFKIVDPTGKEPLLILDGEELPNRLLSAIDPEQIESIEVMKNDVALEKYGREGVVLLTSKKKEYKGVISYIQSNDRNIIISRPSLNIHGITDENPPLIFMDDEEITLEQMKNINPERIESFSILKDGSVTKLYGEEGKNGVVLIKVKK